MGEDLLSCDEIRKKKGSKAWPLRKNQQESDFKFVLRESSFGVFNAFRVSQKCPGGLDSGG